MAGTSASRLFGLSLCLVVAAGCGSPSAANIALRKENQQLQAKVEDLSAARDREAAARLAAERSRPTVPSLPADRLDQLVTVHGLKFGKLTGGDNPTADQPTDTQLKVYVVPTDGDGDPVKAAGSFTVQAFDLDDAAHPLLGTWTFPPADVRGRFFSQFSLYTYVLPCPWQTLPTHADLTVRVTFDDGLTARRFVEQTQCKVRPPAAK